MCGGAKGQKKHTHTHTHKEIKKKRERCRFRLDERLGARGDVPILCTFERITDDRRRRERERKREREREGASDFGIVGYFLPSLQRRWSRREVAWVSPFGVQVLSLSSGILCACQLRQCRCMLSFSLSFFFLPSFIKSLTKEEDHDDDEEEY